MRNKAQTAMEYLMTYGWAILIIIVVVAALYAMGIFTTPGGTIPCSPCFGYFAYRDYSNQIAGACAAPGCLYIRNGARTIVIDSVTDSVGAVTPLDCAAASPCAAGVDIEITDITTTGNQVITVTYTDQDTLVQHTDTATIHN